MLAQHRINPKHDQICFRFLFKLGSRKRPGHSLYECFEAQLEECGIRIEFDSNEGRAQDVATDVDGIRDKEAEIYGTATAWAGTFASRRPRRASFESFYDIVEDSIRPIEPLARSQAPTSLSQVNGISVPEQRPATRASTRPTEKTQIQRMRYLPVTAQTSGGRLTAEEFASGSNSLHLTSVTKKHTKPLIERPSATSQSRQRMLSSLAAAPHEPGASDGDSVPPPIGYQAPFTINPDALLSRPSETQLIRDIDIFQHYSIRLVARASLQNWCGLAFRAKSEHESMQQQANHHDLQTLLRQGLQQWRTSFHRKRKQMETKRFFENLEQRASRARDLYLLTKAFTHWAQSSYDQIQQISVVRRHLLGLKYFNAWYEVTIVNELKVRQYQLSKYLQVWKQSYARVTTFNSQADVWYCESLVKDAYWRWFWTFCERRAPAWRVGKLKKNLFMQWALKQQHVTRKNQLINGLRRGTITRFSFMRWLESVRAMQLSSQEALSFRHRKCLSYALETWKLHRQHIPRAQQISNMVDWRVAGTTFATIMTRYRAGRQAEFVDRLRVMRNAWTGWNDALRHEYLVKRIDDRILTEQLYRWALAQRCGLQYRSCERRLKRQVMSKLATAFFERRQQRDVAFQTLKMIIGNNLAKLALSRWKSEMAAICQRNQLAFQFYAPRISQEVLQAWSIKAGHLRRLNGEAERAAFYIPANKYFKCWQSAAVESKGLKRRNGYIEVRKSLKMKLATRILHQWQDLTTKQSQSYEQACLSENEMLLRFGAGLFDQWRARTNLVERNGEQASQHYAIMVARQYLQHWSDRLRAQWRMEDLARLNDEMRMSNIALTWLHKLHLRAIEMRGREGNAQSLKRFYEKRRSQSILRRWRQNAAKKRGPIPESPSLRDTSFDIDLRPAITPFRMKGSRDFNQGLDPRDLVSTVESNISTASVSEYLSTPSKRAMRAKELVGMSTTPAGTPFRSRLRYSAASGPHSQRVRELGRSTNVGSGTFGVIFEASPRTPGAGSGVTKDF